MTALVLALSAAGAWTFLAMARGGSSEPTLTPISSASSRAGTTAVTRGQAKPDASAEPPDWVWLVDADIHCGAEALSALVWTAVERRHVLSSLMVRLRCESLAERALVPAFVFFFQMIYPFAWVNQANRGTAAAAGGCMLVQRQALADAGGVNAIRGEIIDDCALGRRLKRLGPIHLALSERVQSRRSSPSVAAIRAMVVRSAFAQLGYSFGRLAFVVAAMLTVFVAPVALTALGHGTARGLGLFAWVLMALLFAPIARRYGVSALSGVALPAIAVACLAFTIESAVQYRLGRGGQWKGRAQARRDEAVRAGPP